ncbi:hypothetical protein F4778DRAFT_718355 [Xylariomycetidae sp. FL2044]|nr:hypothetical protein F4778DRAFT_718355 [Xylariomycetidae sp. FL2044]
MAQATGYQPASLALSHQPGPPTMSPAEIDQIREYQKVVNFRDVVVAGKHQRIKVPTAVGKTTTTTSTTAISTTQPSASRTTAVTASSAPTRPGGSVPAVNSHQMENAQSFKANSQHPAVAVVGATPSVAIPGFSNNASNPSKTEINPVLLEKSDDLIKAENKIRRQRIEKSLRDEVDQKKSLAKSTLPPSEQIPDFDLSDVLAKALTLVQATAAPIANNVSPPAEAEASDSFDENTFYSSQHETPESHASPHTRKTPSDVQMQDAPSVPTQRDPYVPAQQPPPTSQPLPLPISRRQQADTDGNAHSLRPSGSSNHYPQNTGMEATISQDKPNPRVANAAREGFVRQQRMRDDVETQVISSDSGVASRSDKSGNTDSDQPFDHSILQTSHPMLPNTSIRHRGEPLVRAHDLSPYAPQPAHVSPLAMGLHSNISERERNTIMGAPAQVTALRQEGGTNTSPESSPQGERGSKKKNKKKNKRKSEGRPAEAPVSPTIKPEPRSPSPLTAPQFTRPQKRIRRAEPEVIYDEPRLERPVSRIRHEVYASGSESIGRAPLGYERVQDPYQGDARHSVSHRMEPPVYEERRPDGTIIQYIRRPRSPVALPYGAPEPRSMRSTTYSAMDHVYREAPAYAREGRMSVRPFADRARSRSPVLVERHSPITAPTTRIMVDEFGREFFEPQRASTAARRSAMPLVRPAEPEAYERAPLRGLSRMAGPETIEQDGVIYRRASPSYGPRRVITQPEYPTDYRSYRERDYSVQPLGPPRPESVQRREAPERRMLPPEEISREYLQRSNSVRPVDAMPYYSRVQSVRPEAPRQYAPSVHPEARRDVVPQALREFSVRPVGAEVSRREYSVRPDERYYERPLPHRDEENAYIGQPRAAPHEIVYADNGRRTVYQ